jgi:hypothetical protein
MPAPRGIASVSRTARVLREHARPRGRTRHDAGHEVMDVPPPMRTLKSSGTPRRTPKVVERYGARRDHERHQEVEEDGLAGRACRYRAAPPRPCRARARAPFWITSGAVTGFLRDHARRQSLPDLPAATAPTVASATRSHHERALLERSSLRSGSGDGASPADRPAARSRSPPCRRSGPVRHLAHGARGTPITTARSGTSRSRPRPQATNASSPTHDPGVSTTPPPIRLARRSTAALEQ